MGNINVIDAETNVGYLWIPTFAVERARGFDEAMARFFADLGAAKTESLVVDVRGNSGGPSLIAVELLRYLIAEPFEYLAPPADPDLAELAVFKHYSQTVRPYRNQTFAGTVFVLIDGGSFSTTGHFCAALRANRKVIFVGEESGGSALCNDNSIRLELPHSKLGLRVARTTFQIQVDDMDDGVGILPDIEIQATVEDLATGTDTVLEYLDGLLGSDLRHAKVAPLTPAPRQSATDAEPAPAGYDRLDKS